MRKAILILCLCAVSAVALGYAAYGQSKEIIDKLKESEKHEKLLEKINDAIKTIESERKVEKELRIFEVSDLLARVTDYAPPSPFVNDVEGLTSSESAMERFEEEHESFEGEPFGPDELIEFIMARTGSHNWPEHVGGFGTIELHRGKLIVCNTPAIVGEIGSILDKIRANLPALISSTIYLFSAEEDYLAKVRKKILADAEKGAGAGLLRTGSLCAYSSQAAYLYCGTVHTYQGDTDTSGAGGLTPVTVFDPIINLFREGLIVGLRAQYNRHTGQVNLVAMVSLSELTSIEEHIGIGGGIGEDPKKCKVETPKVDLQIVSGSSDVPEGYGLLLGGSRMKTAQAKQKSFVVLIVPEVQK